DYRPVHIPTDDDMVRARADALELVRGLLSKTKFLIVVRALLEHELIQQAGSHGHNRVIALAGIVAMTCQVTANSPVERCNPPGIHQGSLACRTLFVATFATPHHFDTCRKSSSTSSLLGPQNDQGQTGTHR